jgi:hypothetical protein
VGDVRCYPGLGAEVLDRGLVTSAHIAGIARVGRTAVEQVTTVGNDRKRIGGLVESRQVGLALEVGIAIRVSVRVAIGLWRKAVGRPGAVWLAAQDCCVISERSIARMPEIGGIRLLAAESPKTEHQPQGEMASALRTQASPP